MMQLYLQTNSQYFLPNKKLKRNFWNNCIQPASKVCQPSLNSNECLYHLHVLIFIRVNRPAVNLFCSSNIGFGFVQDFTGIYRIN